MSNCKVCNKSSQKNPQTNYFRFPKDPSRCELWARNCNLLPEFLKHNSLHFYKSYRICSDHFKNESMYWDGKKKRLLLSAVPDVLKLKQNIVPTPKMLPSIPRGLDIQTARQIDEMLACDDSEFKLEMIEHLCRLCGEEHHSLTLIFGSLGKSLNLLNKMTHLPIKICENDVMPTKICKTCVKKVEDNFNFISKCLEADEKLRIILDMEGRDTSYKNTDNLNSLKSTTIDISESKAIESQDKHILGSDCSELRIVDFSQSRSVRHDHSDILIKNQLTDFEKDKCNIHSENKYYCDLCNKSFPTLPIQEAHSKAHTLVINSTGVYACNECGADFNSRYRLCAHRRRHFGEKPYKCPQCDARFYESSLLGQHRLTHLPKRFTCEVCKKGFLRKSKLITHVKHALHSSDTSEKSNSDANKGKNDNSLKKTYKCVVCPRSLPTLPSLSQHWKTHWTRRKYLCAFCGKRFTRMDSLKNHTRIHTGERPYSCSICGFAFKQRGDCQKHEANHSRVQ